MDSQRPFLYLTLIFMAFLLWTTWQQDHAPKPVIPAETVSQSANSPAVPGSDTGTAVPALPLENAAAQASGEQLIRIRTDVLDLQISNKGGEIVTADLPTYPVSLEEPDKPVRILDRTGRDYVAQSGLKHGTIAGQDVSQWAPDHQAEYSFEQTDYQLAEGQNELVVPLRWQGANGVVVTKRFRLTRGSFSVGVEHEVQNNSGKDWTGVEYRQLRHGPGAHNNNMLTSGVRAFVGGAYYGEGKYSRVGFQDMAGHFPSDQPEKSAITGGWVSVLEHYFISAWVPAKDQQGVYYSLANQPQSGTPSYILGVRSGLKTIPNGSTDSFKDQFWVGPKLQDDLEKVAQGLDLTVDYGIFAFISKPIFWVMQWIHKVVGNWGWTIIFLTLLIKLIFFYPSAMSYKSMAKMKAAAPKLKEIGERFANDPQGKQKAMMEIYKKEKINPLGGCLPILIQIPVFMGLYWVLLESVELRQAPWLLWYKDLSIMDPYFILPLVMGASMFLQQKLNPPQVDPMQQKIFQFLPVVFTFMFLWFPAGLVLYWVVNNVLSIAQQWFINKNIVGHA